MGETWTISVSGRVYGPYTLEQMQGFHAENRLADHSLIARAGEEQFHPAAEDPALAPLFHPALDPENRPPTAPAHEQISEPEREAVSEAAQPHRFGARAEQEHSHAGPAHF